MLGAQIVDEDDAMNVAAHAALIDPDRFQFAEQAERDFIALMDDEERGP